MDEEFFKNELREKVIKLLDSERGLQAKLSKAVGKPSSFFSELKRGNPVNATHLKAIGMVFGAGYVNYLLGIDDICEVDHTPSIEPKRTEESIDDPVINDHIEIVKKFKHKEVAKKINESLLIIDNQNLNKFEDLEYLIKGVARGMDYEYRLYRPNTGSNQSDNFTVLNNDLSLGKLKNGTEE